MQVLYPAPILSRDARELMQTSGDTGLRGRPRLRATVAGLAYVGLVFAAGFVLGILRVLIVIPRVGEIAAVLIELPFLLGLSWLACRWLTKSFDVPPTFGIRLLMSVTAFAVLMFAELAGSTLGFGRTLSEHMAQYRQIAGLLGLAGQIAFAAFPIIQTTTGAAQKRA